MWMFALAIQVGLAAPNGFMGRAMEIVLSHPSSGETARWMGRPRFVVKRSIDFVAAVWTLIGGDRFQARDCWRSSAVRTGGMQVRPLQTSAQASAPSGCGTWSRVSASASGNSPGLRRAGSMRTTVL